MITYNQLLHKYYPLFKERELPLETLKVFLFELCNEENVDMFLELDNEVKESILNKFESGLPRLLEEEPLNYVLGYTHFFGYKILVNKDCLIPRYETEELVGLILSKIDEYYPKGQINVCDIGTGSGAIGISLCKEENRIKMYASDISKEAIVLAKENAKLNDVNIEYFVGDMLEPYIENNIKVDILISNPPYIPSQETLERSVKEYEPHVALFGGEDGLKFYRIIFENAKKILNENASLFFEIGYDQKERLMNLAKQYFENSLIEVYKDINNKDRMLMIKL